MGILAQGMIIPGEFQDPEIREGETNDQGRRQRLDSVYGIVGTYDFKPLGVSELPLRMQRIVGSILESNADIVCLQELDLVHLFSKRMAEVGYTLVAYQQKRKRNGKCHTVDYDGKLNAKGKMEGDLDGVAIYVKDLNKEDSRLRLVTEYQNEANRRPCPDCEGNLIKNPAADAGCNLCDPEKPGFLLPATGDRIDNTGFMGLAGRGYGLPILPKVGGCKRMTADRTRFAFCGGKKTPVGDGTFICGQNRKNKGCGEAWQENGIEVGELLHQIENRAWEEAEVNNAWKQVMAHVHLQLVKDSKGNPIEEPMDIDVFSFHGKSGEAQKDLPVKIAQAEYVANAIGEVKRLRERTHIFCPCDFNSHIANNPENPKNDTYSRFAAQLRKHNVNMVSAYFDVFGKHTAWTCVKTREWPNHSTKEPNQINKIGTTSNCIDYVGHCVNSVVAAVSNLVVRGLPVTDYWKTFPSIHAPSDHGKPLVVKFLLKGGVERNLETRSNSTEANRNRQKIEDEKKKMDEVKTKAGEKDVEIKVRLIMREFGRKKFIQTLKYTTITEYTTGLLDYCKTTQMKSFIKKMKDASDVDIKENLNKNENGDQMLESIRQRIMEDRRAHPDCQTVDLTITAVEILNYHYGRLIETLTVTKASKARQAAGAAVVDVPAEAQVSAHNEEQLVAEQWDEFKKSKFIWYNDDTNAPTGTRWAEYTANEQSELFKAFVLDGKTACETEHGTVCAGKPDDKEFNNAQFRKTWLDKCPQPTSNGENCGDRDCAVCKGYKTWGEWYWAMLQKSKYHQKSASNWIRPVARMGDLPFERRRRLLAHGARTSPVLAALMKEIEDAKDVYYNSRCR